ncbi:TetR/AcrR family transcriptional regulator [Stappia sp. 28M-7]|uniref:TetR/AcrR family transcriptional regulator n=1 Tax=Stappia sp. 28M-7 TaxID=2762596 RepID=UPI00163C1BF8|nr:TetR/AcrR family transcriptional regulator [Stappia sp. 28M-7]MBC2860104.1 TetR/AcrR family transcriptional regulator [Stappia sp. 28M-7]
MTQSDSAAETPKPRRRRKEARPGEIIDAGLQEFAENGFAATRLEDVAKRAGVVKGTIYRYFSSKEELFEAALASRITPFFDDVAGLVAAYPGSSEELVRTALPRIYKALFEDGLHVLMRIIITEGGRFPAIAELYHRRVISRGQEVIAALVRRGVERGEFRRSALTDLPIVVVAPAVMTIVWKMTFDRFEPIETRRFLAAHVDMVLEGLLAKDKGEPPRAGG